MSAKVIIIGAGGHAWVVADILLQMHSIDKRIRPIGFLDDNTALHNCHILGLPVLASISDGLSIPHDAVIIAIGDNQIRYRLFNLLVQREERFITACHPQAIMASSTTIGKGSVISAGAIVNPGSEIGANTILNTGCSVGHRCQIGPHAHIGPGARLGGEVTVGAGALIGIGATVMPQRKVGAWSIVGAGSVVTKDVPDHTIVVGAPAKTISAVAQQPLNSNKDPL